MEQTQAAPHMNTRQLRRLLKYCRVHATNRTYSPVSLRLMAANAGLYWVPSRDNLELQIQLLWGLRELERRGHILLKPGSHNSILMKLTHVSRRFR
jgi:hypothetical protein